jgi:hypothetical protein
MTEDPRLRRQAHRLASVAGGLPPDQAAELADPSSVMLHPDPVMAATRLAVLADDMRAQLTGPEEEAEPIPGQLQLQPDPPLDLGPGYPADYPEAAQTGNLPASSPAGPPLEEAAAGNLPVSDVDECSCPPGGVCPASCQVCEVLPDDAPCPNDTQEADSPAPAGGQEEPPPSDAPPPGLLPAPPAAVHLGEGDAPPSGPLLQAPTVAGRVLAWASRHDPRSLDFLVRDRLAHPVPVQDLARPHGPILDQGTVPPLSIHDGSSCTGHMAANLANGLTIAGGPSNGGTSLGRMKTHDDAVDLYHLAQQLDDWPGEAYPGTSVLAAMKAGVKLGWWSSYVWAKGTRDIAQAILQVGMVGIGIPWLAGMMTPDAHGIISVTGSQDGGHAIALHAIARSVAGRPGPWFGALQTYGEEVGDHGVVWLHHADLARLLAGVGEAAIPLRGPA